MSSKSLGKMFEGDVADMSAEIFSLVSMIEWRVSFAQTWEQGPSSALAEISNNFGFLHHIPNMSWNMFILQF